jgi:uroporphyrin-III C-methyltransferase/precorrin-2 dehydrogenase/sirohydrochlorin ferrochelatase
MRYFPAFMDLSGRDVFISGAGELGVRKARLLRSSGARLTFFDADDGSLANREFDGEARFWPNPLGDEAFAANPALVVAATGDEAKDRRTAQIAKAHGVPVNAVDMPELCDVVIPSIVERGDMVVGISTGGAAPVLGRRVREQLEAMLPQRLGDLIAFAKDRRERVADALSGSERRAFWERFFDGAGRDAVLSEDETAAEEAFEQALRGDTLGHVFIVGAGPGDPELLTLKALRVCQEADVILHDNLVSDEILTLCRRDAERIYVGKKRSEHALPQEAIGQLMVRLANEGKRVVRLKGGDPFVFGRGGEELLALKEAGIAASVVPGISAAMGCAASAELPLTHRGLSQSVTFVTAEAGGGGAPSVDWQALARLKGTIVVYMGVSRAGDVGAALIEGGLDASTPIAVIADGTRLTERIIRADLGRLGEAAARIAAPAVLVIGEAASMARGEELIALTDERRAA